MKKIPKAAVEKLYPEIERVIDLVLGAFEGKQIPNGAVILGLGAVIGLTLNEGMGGLGMPEAPEIEDVLPYLEVGMEIGRTLEISRVQ